MTGSWLEARLAVLQPHEGPALLSGDAESGASHLVRALHAARRPLVWLELGPAEAGDPVGQGNVLADALARTLSNPLFGYAMPYAYGLSVLRGHLELLGPFTFALGGAEYGLELARDLLEFQGGGNRVVLHFGELPPGFGLPEGALHLCPDHLRLSEAEALDLAGGRFSLEAVRGVLEASGGAYESFSLMLAERCGLPPPLRPSPTGPRPVLGEALEPEGLLEVLTRQERWLEALELAAHHAPERAPELLERGRVKLWAQGRQVHLYRLLSALPREIQQREVVLAL